MCIKKVCLLSYIAILFILAPSCGAATFVNEKGSSWKNTELRAMPVYYCFDGYSPYAIAEYPMTRETLEQVMIEPLVQGGVAGIMWGLNPGQRLSYDTKVGQLFGEGLTDEQWAKARKLD